LDDRAITFRGPGTFPTLEQLDEFVPWNEEHSETKSRPNLSAPADDSAVDKAARPFLELTNYDPDQSL
jgi:hypothetical protein